MVNFNPWEGNRLWKEDNKFNIGHVEFAVERFPKSWRAPTITCTFGASIFLDVDSQAWARHEFLIACWMHRPLFLCCSLLMLDQDTGLHKTQTQKLCQCPNQLWQWIFLGKWFLRFFVLLDPFVVTLWLKYDAFWRLKCLFPLFFFFWWYWASYITLVI